MRSVILHTLVTVFCILFNHMEEEDSSEIALDFSPTIRIYKDGRIERLVFVETIPPSTDPDSDCQSKDVIISQETGVAARLFLPKNKTQLHKIPLLIYIHGGAFCTGSPFAVEFHNHVTALAVKAKAIAVSVHYRRAPEDPLPIAYEDSWSALQWVAAHFNGEGPEAWINDHADLGRVFLAGESAGANLCHNMGMRIGLEGVGLPGLNPVGLVLVHPFFGNDKPDKIIEAFYPTCTDLDDPKINPAKDPDLASLGCRNVLVFVAEKDPLKDRGCTYYKALKKSGWVGEVEIFETEGEGHAFHLSNPDNEKAIAIVEKIVSFITQHH